MSVPCEIGNSFTDKTEYLKYKSASPKWIESIISVSIKNKKHSMITKLCIQKVFLFTNSC